MRALLSFEALYGLVSRRLPPEASVFWCAALLTACTHPLTSCGKDPKAVFDTPPPNPRSALVAIRAYRGSREALMAAATSMMVANPRLGRAAGGADPVFLAATHDEPAVAVSGYTFESSVSVSEIHRMLAAVAERLQPMGEAAAAQPTLELELWWVQGVHGNEAGQPLPSPLILNGWWANDLFAVAASSRAVAAGERGLEDKGWLTRVARMFEANRGKGVDSRIVGHGQTNKLELKQEGAQFIYQQSGSDEADVIASGTEMAFAADLHLKRYRDEEKFRIGSIYDQASALEDAYEARQLDWVEPVAVDVAPGATLGERFAQWVRAARASSEQARLAVRRVVLFDYSARGMRGALIGARVAGAELPSASGLEHTTHFDTITNGGSTLLVAKGTLAVPTLSAPDTQE